MTILSTDDFMAVYGAALADKLQTMGVPHATIRAATEAAAEEARAVLDVDQVDAEPLPPQEMGEIDLKNGFATLTIQLVKHYEHTDSDTARSRVADFLLSLVSVLTEGPQ